MSGVEAAGFVLAVLPLLISALEDYRKGSEPLKDWWRFRTVYKECYQNISIQKIFFEENLEQLLTPLVEDEGQLAALLEKPGGDGWKDPDLEEMLKKKMPKSYDLYLGVIEEMNDVVEKLGNGLGITKVRQQQILQEEVRTLHACPGLFELIERHFRKSRPSSEALPETSTDMLAGLKIGLASTKSVFGARLYRKR
jgi:hypothetical protein